jgi:hypothetical protein
METVTETDPEDIMMALCLETFTATQKGLVYTSWNIAAKEYCIATCFPPKCSIPTPEHAAELGLPAGKLFLSQWLCHLQLNFEYMTKREFERYRERHLRDLSFVDCQPDSPRATLAFPPFTVVPGFVEKGSFFNAEFYDIRECGGSRIVAVYIVLSASRRRFAQIRLLALELRGETVRADQKPSVLCSISE